MHCFNKIKLQVCDDSKEALILKSYDDFRTWYLQNHDLSIFSENEIEELLKEEQPDSYPCVPLLADGGFEVFYVSTDLIKCWKDSLS